MDYRIAEFVREIDLNERLTDLVNEAKADTWRKYLEHTVLGLEDGRLIMVPGGRDGILLVDRGDAGLYVEIAQSQYRVARLAWHTHPQPTGPSDYDRAILMRLNQESSVIYEIRGDPEGTHFTSK
jgi:hypothetical protein